MTPSPSQDPPQASGPSQGHPPLSTFDPHQHLADKVQNVRDLLDDQTIDPLATSEGRQVMCHDDPLAFALIYLPDLISNGQGEISFAEAHFEWCDQAKAWMTPGKSRDAYLAPRGLGKSTWWFIILPMWAAAFGHVKFISAISASATQARAHLANFKRHLDNNDLLRSDFPDLCNAMRRPGNSKPVADREERYLAKSGFTFDADGIDAKFRGKNANGVRPDLIVLDDFEDEDSNPADLLNVLRQKVFYMNRVARVILSGTVSKTGSVLHDLVRSVDEDPEEWITNMDPAIQVHHHKPILTNDDGNERSIWPQNPAFDLEEMQQARSQPDFMQEYMNLPVAGEGALWMPSFFKYGTPEGVGKVVLSVDPAVSTKKASDFTGIAVVGLSLKAKSAVVFDCWQLKRSPEEVREFVLKVCDAYPITEILIETNQGGSWLMSQFHDMPVQVKTKHQRDSKEFRAARAAGLYSRGAVFHAKKIPALEAQMMAFPKVTNDDQVDAVTTGLLYFVEALKAKKSALNQRPRQGTYL